jgi:adenine-specific DNA-methyltransferase
LRYPFYVNLNNPDENGMFSVSTLKTEGYTCIYPSTINGLESVWRWGRDKAEKENDKLAAYVGNDSEIRVFQKERKLSQMAKTVWIDKEYISNKGTSELQSLLGKGVFDFPKPINLLKIIVEIGLDMDSIILDFFSGSATTAHAIMQLNAEDNGNRKYIMVQLPEITDEKSEAFKSGYKNICEIGKERIRRAAEKIKEETKAEIDYGFRVYRLDESNMQDVYYKPQDYNQGQLDAFADNVKADRTSEDLLAQVILDWGLPLSLRIETKEILGKQVFKVAENSLFACFDEGIDDDFAKELASEMPLRVVFKDSAFKDDTAKTNVKQLLKQLSPNTEMKVI